MAVATLTSKGQITLPKEVRDRLRVSTGDTVEFAIGADGEMRVRAGHHDVRALSGLLARPGRKSVSVRRMHAVVRKAASAR